MDQIKTHKLSRISWQLPLLIMPVMLFLTPMIKTPVASMLMGVIYLLLFFIGTIIGIISLVSARKHKLLKASFLSATGIFLNIALPSLLIAIAVPSFNKARSQSAQKYLEMVEAEFASKIPIMVDELTRLDEVKVTGNKSMTYTYTLVSTLKDEVDESVFTQEMKATLYDQFMSLPQLEMLRKLDVTTTYVYLDKNGSLISLIEIKKDL